MSSATQSRACARGSPALVRRCGRPRSRRRAASPVNQALLLRRPGRCRCPIAWWTLRSPGRWLALFFGDRAAAAAAAHRHRRFRPAHLASCSPPWASSRACSGWPSGASRSPASNAAFVALFGVLLASVASAAWYSGRRRRGGQPGARRALRHLGLRLLHGAYGPAGTRHAMAACAASIGSAVASALFACVDFYYQFPAPAGYGPQFVWLDSGVYRRAQGLFYEASTLGNFCAFFLVMIAVAFTRPRREVAGLAQCALAARRRGLLRRPGALLLARLADQSRRSRSRC